MNIQHIEKTNRFIIELDGGLEAELKYRMVGDKSIDFYSTFVPNTHRGKGIAAKLVKTGIDWASKMGYEIHASCWYARNHL